MQILANGKKKEAEEGWTVNDLVRSFDLDPKFVIVEYNGEALARQRYEDTALAEGDRLELVKAVAGG